MVQNATKDEIKEIIRKHSLEFLKCIGLEPKLVLFTSPLEDKIRIEVRDKSLVTVPDSAVFELDNKKVKIAIELTSYDNRAH